MNIFSIIHASSINWVLKFSQYQTSFTVYSNFNQWYGKHKNRKIHVVSERLVLFLNDDYIECVTICAVPIISSSSSSSTSSPGGKTIHLHVKSLSILLGNSSAYGCSYLNTNSQQTHINSQYTSDKSILQLVYFSKEEKHIPSDKPTDICRNKVTLRHLYR